MKTPNEHVDDVQHGKDGRAFPGSWRTVVALALLVSACDKQAPAASASGVPPQAPRGTAQLLENDDPNDPTGGDPVTRQQAELEVEAEVEAHAYQPSSQLQPSADPGASAGYSHLADLQAVQQRLASAYGGVTTSCNFPPCALSGDFDGDGRRDWAVQVATSQNYKAGVAFALGDSTQLLLAAGTTSALGTDTSWARSWSLKTGAEAQALSGGAARGHVVVLSGPSEGGEEKSALVFMTGAASSQMSIQSEWRQPAAQ